MISSDTAVKGGLGEMVGSADFSSDSSLASSFPACWCETGDSCMSAGRVVSGEVIVLSDSSSEFR
jgi:hypothetical protein